MSLTLVESAELGTPYQCPLCMRLFYFDNDYIRHKCVARHRKIDLFKRRK